MDATVRDLARGWCTDRAVPGAAADGIVMLLRLALGHGLRFHPRAVAIDLRWLDADRVAVDLRWRGSSRVTGSATAGHESVEWTPAAFDAIAESWGLRVSASEPVHWFVVDTA